MLKKSKKSIFLSLMFSVAFISTPAYADQMADEHVQPEKQGKLHNAKKAALKQYHESVARWNKCLHGKCDRWEALKAARDLTIAVAGMITAMYVTGSAMEGVAGAGKLGGAMLPGSLQPVVGVPARGMQAVGELLKMPAEKIGSATRHLIGGPKFKEGQKVNFIGLDNKIYENFKIERINYGQDGLSADLISNDKKNRNYRSVSIHLLRMP